ncbi:MAG: adaptor protein MecA [Lachnospiraceae bacterium]|nr:adaptor protein MecA [Lachnospiraceae bacterium]
MRIERINENSIRCTLTNFDLSVRNVKLSELTYGSEKARNLFREMMQRASHEVGFDAEDIPIMVEAIPMPNDSIMLIITKIDDPEELDTRFSKFSPSDEDEDSSWSPLATELLEGADGLLNLLGDPGLLESLAQAGGGFDSLNSGALSSNGGFGGLNQADTAAGNAASKSAKPAGISPAQSSMPAENVPANAPQNVRIYQFDTLDLVCAAAKETSGIFTGESVLYKNSVNEKFYLLLRKESCDELAFSKTCNKLSEYAARQKYDPAVEAYYAEHYEVFVKKNALQVLADL